MLDLRPNGECCNKDLPPSSTKARICSFECTFCASCADGVLQARCPNCDGERVHRPRRLGVISTYFTGRADNFDQETASTNPYNARLDPESIRVSRDGRSVFISDE